MPMFNSDHYKMKAYQSEKNWIEGTSLVVAVMGFIFILTMKPSLILIGLIVWIGGGISYSIARYYLRKLEKKLFGVEITI